MSPDESHSALQIYEDFVREYIDITNPSILCYDLYPISSLIKNEDEGSEFNGFPGLVQEMTVNWATFYNDLALYHDIVNEKKASNPNITFWTYLQSASFLNTGKLTPDATEEYLRFAVFSALAYGVQGLIYFTYAQRRDNTDESFRSALVDLDGGKLPQ